MNCPKCRSSRVVKCGKVPTVGRGLRQRVRCQKCGSTFYDKR